MKRKLLLVSLILVSTGFLGACNDDKNEPETKQGKTSSTTAKQNTNTERVAVETEKAATEKTNEITMPKTVHAIISTNKGDIRLELDGEKAPLTVANFVKYAESGHYDGTIFHRVIPSFMIQGGGFEPGMKQKKTQSPIKNEANNGLSNANLTIAMARTNDPHSATSQFFINVVDNARLDFKGESPHLWGYAVFGKVTEGAEVVTAIENVSTGQVGPHGDVPNEDVVINSVKIVE